MRNSGKFARTTARTMFSIPTIARRCRDEILIKMIIRVTTRQKSNKGLPNLLTLKQALLEIFTNAYLIFLFYLFFTELIQWKTN